MITDLEARRAARKEKRQELYNEELGGNVPVAQSNADDKPENPEADTLATTDDSENPAQNNGGGPDWNPNA